MTGLTSVFGSTGCLAFKSAGNLKLLASKAVS